MKNVEKMLVGKTIEKIEFLSWQAENDILILWFTDKTHLKIQSDPQQDFSGLSFYVMKTRTVEEKYDEEIK